MKRLLFYILIIISFSLINCSGKTQHLEKGYIYLNMEDLEKVNKLTGEWEFYWNELFYPGEITNILQPQYTEIPHKWNNWKIDDNITLSNEGYATYRAIIEVEETNQLYALNIPGMAGSYQLWVNDLLLITNGNVMAKDNPNLFSLAPHIVTIPTYSKRYEIILHIQNDTHPFGGFWKAIQFGNHQKIREKREKDIALIIFITGGMVFMSLYLGGLYFFGKENPSILFIGIYSLIMAVRNLFIGNMFIYSLIPSLSYGLHLRIELLTTYLGMIVFAEFIKKFYQTPIAKKIMEFLQILFIIPTVLIFVFPLHWITLVRILYQIVLMLTAFIFMYILIRAKQREKKGASLMIFGMGIFIITIINDILTKNMIISTPELGSYGFFIFLSFLTVILSMEIVRTYRSVMELSQKLNTEMEIKRQNLDKLKYQEEELKHHREHLEDMIRERTHELSVTMKELTERTQEMERTNTQMELALDLLAHVSRKIGTSFSAREIAKTLLEQAKKYMPFPDGSVFLYNPETRLLECIAGLGGGSTSQSSFKPGEGIAGNAFSKDIPIYVEDTNQDERFATKETNPKSLYCVPIHNRNEVIGVLNLGSSSEMDYSDENLKFLNILIAFGGIAIENALLYEKLERKVFQRTRQLEEEQKKLMKQNKIIEDELVLARTIQMQFIPSQSPPNMAFYYKPMYQVGGDFIDFIELPDGKIGIFLSDVSGHGIPAALLTSIIKSVMLEFSEHMIDPSRFLMFLNNRLLNFTAGNFVTAFYGIYDPHEMNFIYSSAGHNAPFLLRDEEIKSISTDQRGLALGFYDNSEMLFFDKLFQNSYLQLEPGDKMLLYTDGLIEAVNVKEISNDHTTGIPDFEASKLPQILKKNYYLPAQDMINIIVDELIAFRGDENFDDDVCIVCMDVVSRE